MSSTYRIVGHRDETKRCQGCGFSTERFVLLAKSDYPEGILFPRCQSCADLMLDGKAPSFGPWNRHILKQMEQVFGG